jgi:predicted peptidase
MTISCRNAICLLGLFGLLGLAGGCKPSGPVSIPPAGKLPNLEAGMNRERLDVPQVGKVRCAIDIPETYDGQTPVPLVLMLHYGYVGAAPEAYTGVDMIKTFGKGSKELGAITIAPDALGGDWTSRRNEQAAMWLVNSAMQTWNIDPERVIVTGYSMGGEGAWYLGSKHQDVFTAAVPIAAPVAGANNWKIPVYAVHSESDDIVPYEAARSHAAAVKAAGGNVKFRTAFGPTHYDTERYGNYFVEAAHWLQDQWKQPAGNPVAAAERR